MSCTKLDYETRCLNFPCFKKGQFPHSFWASHTFSNKSLMTKWKTLAHVWRLQYYLLEDVRSKYSPSFFHLTTGCGYPLGGAHLRIVSSPTETSVSFGRILKSSLMSATYKRKYYYNMWSGSLNLACIDRFMALNTTMCANPTLQPCLLFAKIRLKN